MSGAAPVDLCASRARLHPIPIARIMAWPLRAVNELTSMRLNRQSNPGKFLAAGLLAAVAGVRGGCAQVPTMPEPVPNGPASEIAVTGPRGPLSQRQTDTLLKRL